MTYQKTCVICPHCEAKTDASIDHLKPGQPAGPWYCDACGGSYNLIGGASPSEAVVTKGASRKTPTLDLLVLNPQDAPVYVALRGFIIHDNPYSFTGRPRGAVESEHEQGMARFFYETHSCPTNWLQHIAMLAHKGDTDPHGLLTFVRRVPLPAPVGGQDCQAEDEAILQAFPEMGDKS